jgi:hypothetical protein
LSNWFLLNCSDVTDAVLVAIATHMPALDSLSLTGSSGYGSARAAARVRSLKQLRRIVVAQDHLVFSPTVIQVWQNRVPVLWQCEGFPSLEVTR